MDCSAELRLFAIRAERTLAEAPANRERRRIARLAAEIARCCRVGLVDRLVAALHRPLIGRAGALR